MNGYLAISMVTRPAGSEEVQAVLDENRGAGSTTTAAFMPGFESASARGADVTWIRSRLVGNRHRQGLVIALRERRPVVTELKWMRITRAVDQTTVLNGGGPEVCADRASIAPSTVVRLILIIVLAWCGCTMGPDVPVAQRRRGTERPPHRQQTPDRFGR